MQAAQVSESAAKELEGPPFPEELRQVWDDFCELNNARPAGGMGLGAVTYEGIAAWASLNQVTVTRFMLEVFKRLDRLWLKIAAEANRG